MRNVLTIYKKEFFSYFTTPMAYIFLVVFAILNGYFFSNNSNQKPEDRKEDTYNIKTECMGRMALADETENPIRVKLFGQTN